MYNYDTLSHMQDMPFILNETNYLLRNCFEGNNYYEENLGNGRKCFIFFSGNGLYYPNDYPTAINALINNNHYEWQNIAKSDLIRSQAGKIIFLRDVFKQWYVTGINSEINSIAKLFIFLREKTKGYEVITVGNSAGGYMATLFGALLSAKLVLNFSGQYVINPNELEDEYYYLKKYANDKFFSQFFDIRPFLKANSDVPIMYFFPFKSEEDMEQYALTKDIKNIFAFAFDNAEHGRSMCGRDMPCVIASEPDILQKLCMLFLGKIIDPLQFSLNLYYVHTMEYFKTKKVLKTIYGDNVRRN